MAKGRIIWSEDAQSDFLATLTFYAERNGNKSYSEKLAGEIQESIKKLREYPLGRPVHGESVRIIRRGDYQIYYEL